MTVRQGTFTRLSHLMTAFYLKSTRMALLNWTKRLLSLVLVSSTDHYTVLPILLPSLFYLWETLDGQSEATGPPRGSPPGKRASRQRKAYLMFLGSTHQLPRAFRAGGFRQQLAMTLPLTLPTLQISNLLALLPVSFPFFCSPDLFHLWRVFKVVWDGLTASPPGGPRGTATVNHA